MKEELKIEYIKRSELKEWEKNPRTINDIELDKLIRDIKDLGIYKPLLIGKDKIVYGGNMRLRAYEQLKIEEIPVIILPTTDKKKLMRIAFSDNNRNGVYDVDMIEALTVEFPDFDWNLVAVDFKPPNTVKDVLTAYENINEKEIDENLSTKLKCPKCGYVW